MYADAGNGLLFLLFWPFFSNHEYCRYLCASVPQLAATHFLLVGLGIVQDESLVVSATVLISTLHTPNMTLISCTSYNIYRLCSDCPGTH